MIKFKTNKRDSKLISKIIDRAMDSGNYDDRLTLEMDVTACHLNDSELNLEALLNADNFDFFHDVGGIHNHIDRNTGKLMKFFCPRFLKN